MRIESFKRALISISLIFTLVISMAFTATLVLAPLVIYEPGGTTIEVEQGQEFILRFRLRWDIPGELGYFSFGIYWDCPENDPAENFTFENAAAYFDLDNDNLPDPGLDPIDIIVNRTEGAVGTGTRYAIVVSKAGDLRDGEFNVDLRMRASGAGGTPHVPTGNHPIVISGTINVPEGAVWYSYSPPNPYITIRVVPPPIDKPSQPTLFSPADGTRTNDNTPTFEWTCGSNADNHRLLVDNDASFASPEVNVLLGATDNTYTVTTPLADENYSWKVIAIKGVQENSSIVWTFLIDTAPPVLAGGVIYEPGGTTIEVEQGQEFILRFRLRWDIPGELGYFSFGIYWDCPENDPAENFTFENAAAYFDLDNDNLPDPGLDPIDIIVNRTEGAVGTGTRYAIVVSKAGDLRDGEFNVDLRMRASGAGGTPHVPTGNHPIVISGTINVPEGAVWYSYSPPNPYITVRVLGPDVTVAISPSYQSGQPGVTLGYTVTITNTGTVDDNYDLSVSDNESWGPMVLPTSLTIAADASDSATLSVVVPSDAYGGTQDNITVTATSTENAEVSDSASCIAQAAVFRAVAVSIEPSSIKALQGATLPYTVTIKNGGNVDDIYDLTASDTKGWGPTLPENIPVPAFENSTTTLNITIPENAVPSEEDNITVTATSQENAQVSDNDSCIAHRVKAEFSLITVYKVALDLDFYLHTGARIVAKFYTYTGTYDNESIVWNGPTPTQVTLSENVPHPENKPVENLTLYLTDDVGNVIETIDSYVVTRSELIKRMSQIKGRWDLAPPPEKTALIREMAGIKGQWDLAPP